MTRLFQYINMEEKKVLCQLVRDVERTFPTYL
jgi:hypothetical protein